MAVSETISLLISVLTSAARSDLSSFLLSTTEMIKSFPEDTELTLLLEKNVFSLNVSNQNYVFQDPLFCQTQINLYSDVPAFLVYANNEIFIKFAYV